jgi:hypothetical protein
MIFGWFDAKAARGFGEELASAFVERVPIDRNLKAHKFESRAKAALGELARSVADLRKQHMLNTYQKAALGNAFKWALKDAGYEDEYVDRLTDWLLLQLQ